MSQMKIKLLHFFNIECNKKVSQNLKGEPIQVKWWKQKYCLESNTLISGSTLLSPPSVNQRHTTTFFVLTNHGTAVDYLTCFGGKIGSWIYHMPCHDTK